MSGSSVVGGAGAAAGAVGAGAGGATGAAAAVCTGGGRGRRQELDEDLSSRPLVVGGDGGVWARAGSEAPAIRTNDGGEHDQGTVAHRDDPYAFAA